jgi:uracil-DNA glycosylase
MKVLFVGEAPSADGHGTVEPFSGRSGKRLATLCGMEHLEWLRSCARVNLLPCQPEGGWPAKEARAAAERLDLGEAKVVICCGKRVALAFRFCGWSLQPYEWVGGRTIALIPHPSGRCRAWNDPEVAARVREFLAAILGRQTGEG